MPANACLGLVFGALVGALFLAVLLVIVVWQYSPIGGALIVSVLPLAALAARPLARRLPRIAAVCGGCRLLAAGLVALALLPSVERPARDVRARALRRRARVWPCRCSPTRRSTRPPASRVAERSRSASVTSGSCSRSRRLRRCSRRICPTSGDRAELKATGRPARRADRDHRQGADRARPPARRSIKRRTARSPTSPSRSTSAARATDSKLRAARDDLVARDRGDDHARIPARLPACGCRLPRLQFVLAAPLPAEDRRR